jgi:hypothetical protein
MMQAMLILSILLLIIIALSNAETIVAPNFLVIIADDLGIYYIYIYYNKNIY